MRIEILKEKFGYQSFRPGQDEVIGAILKNRDVLAVMPTGAGKSLCFQIPALMFEGITLVISPLISLMRDQVAALTQNGVPAAFINSSLTQAQTDKALFRAARGQYKIIYVAPERLEAVPFLDFVKNADISMVAVDEAHCVSHWGQDFRPSYLNIASFISSLPKRPVVAAFTATATEEVKADIVRLLELENPLCVSTGFNRENLYFEVRRIKDKYGELTNYLRENKNKSGIVYCATRKAVDEVASRLVGGGFSACAYHAGLAQGERAAAQEDFVYDRKNIMIATNAFGMGIDKSNIAFVIHYNMPKNMESYYQEAGRAGRDGSPAECILFFSPQDIMINKYLIEHTDEENPLPPYELEAVKARDYKRLRQIEMYCKTTACLRRYILDYFGDNEDIICDNCGNCCGEWESVDVTVETQKILSCVYRLNRRYGIVTVADVLHGAKTKKLLDFGLDKNKSYGIMADKNVREIRAIADYLVQNDYLFITTGEYPVVGITEKGNNLLISKEKVCMTVLPAIEEEKEKLKKPEKPEKPGKAGRPGKKQAAAGAGIDQELFDRLKELRMKIAKEERVPAFVIFADAALVDMCARMPADEASFLEVSGVGKVKLEKYGAKFLSVINSSKQ